MNKIKVIDLLNKIAKGEEVPKKIKLDNYEFQYNKTYEQYNNKYATNLLEHISDYNYSGFNDEVEIIEEEKEIEKINVWYEFDGKNNDEIIYIMCTELKDKINELIDVVNELKRDKE